MARLQDAEQKVEKEFRVLAGKLIKAGEHYPQGSKVMLGPVDAERHLRNGAVVAVDEPDPEPPPAPDGSIPGVSDSKPAEGTPRP